MLSNQMAYVRFIRRRRYTLVKLFLVGFALIGVFLWLYMRNVDETLKPVKQPKILKDTDTINDHNKLNYRIIHKNLIDSNIFEVRRDSVFRNPALLHKLKPKLSNSHGKEKNVPHKFNLDSHLVSFNFSIPQLKVTPGLGEKGAAVILPKDEQKLADKVFKEAAFNVYLSDRISPNRSIPDSRNPK